VHGRATDRGGGAAGVLAVLHERLNPTHGACAWTVGRTVSGFSTSNHGEDAQYGHLERNT
jgi:hypothetical protein